MRESRLGKHLSEETKQKIKNSNMGKHNHSEETRKKLSKPGEKHPFFGKHHTDETKQKMRDAHKGQVPWTKGKHHSEETKQKMKQAWLKRKGILEMNECT